MQKKFWFPKTMPERLTFFLNFRLKIGQYEAALGFSSEEITAMETLADQFIAAYEWVNNCHATLKAAYAWRDEIYGNSSVGSAIPEAPAFIAPPSLSGKRGIIEQMYKFRRQIVTSPGYSASIGADLGVIGSAEAKNVVENFAPQLQITVSEGHTLSMSGSMEKMPAMLIEYKPQNGTWKRAAFLTNMPATINISPADATDFERGSVRAIYYANNAVFGTYSPEYPVVLY